MNESSIFVAGIVGVLTFFLLRTFVDFGALLGVGIESIDINLFLSLIFAVVVAGSVFVGMNEKSISSA